CAATTSARFEVNRSDELRVTNTQMFLLNGSPPCKPLVTNPPRLGASTTQGRTMKHLKTLGLAVAMAAALTALIGTATASATVICKNNTSTSNCTERYLVGTEGTASLATGTTGILETLSGETLVTCSESVVKSTLANAGSATTTVESGLSSITFGGCTRTLATLRPGSAELHHIAGTDNGTLTTKNTEVTVNGIFGSSCVYGAGAALNVGTTVGGNPGSLTINTIVPRISGGFLCPSETRLTAKYVATNPTNAWVAAS
ncbi:MAG: hypothetical protein M3335_10190, partial [Actinomycetota bacterium]|nr:hypothetical protein [Actinomycetota bacterium]